MREPKSRSYRDSADVDRVFSDVIENEPVCLILSLEGWC